MSFRDSGRSEMINTSSRPLTRWRTFDLLEELIRIVNKAQERDAEDERRLYHPMLRDRPAEAK